MEQTRALQIDELAQALGLNPKTIRYYEEISLLSPPHRSAKGYRLYTAHDAIYLRFLLKAKTLGLRSKKSARLLSCSAQESSRAITLNC